MKEGSEGAIVRTNVKSHRAHWQRSCQEGMPTGTVLDIFCDSINLRHKIDIKDEFEKNQENLHTIGLENLLLSKTQFIMDYPKAEQV